MPTAVWTVLGNRVLLSCKL